METGRWNHYLDIFQLRNILGIMIKRCPEPDLHIMGTDGFARGCNCNRTLQPHILMSKKVILIYNCLLTLSEESITKCTLS